MVGCVKYLVYINFSDVDDVVHYYRSIQHLSWSGLVRFTRLARCWFSSPTLPC